MLSLLHGSWSAMVASLVRRSSMRSSTSSSWRLRFSACRAIHSSAQERL
jgi:hypothetical protein